MGQHYYRSASNNLLARTADRTPKTFALQGDPSRSTFPPSSKRSSYIVPPGSPRWCGVEVWRGGCQLRCRPRHLTEVQNYEVRPKIALVLLQNGTLI
ncbi:hypothetical protein AVEN_180117-1 [Araneus ventricosus]|uniref:Uncharacterized protein n=1 Tax=Araneus ventricosus TaxID=182803 RepID=A0A4Y2VM55_ARAVE|nr:hypothetical protein AVEN_180117-1 [Araneus ventricosus]